MANTGLPHQIPYLEPPDPPSLHGITSAMAAQIAARLGFTGKSIVATSESRTNTAYGLMTTPDRVQSVVLPAGGLITIAFQAAWKESVAGAARASLFLGSSQIVQARVNQNSPDAATGAAEAFLNATANTWRPLGSYPNGLQSQNSLASSADYTGDVTTGQFVGAPYTGANATAVGGVCHVFAAAGTYDVGVQFKASSGSVSVRDRKLWVRVMAF